MPVGGSRHYQGPGLGEAAGWECPACGGENQGPLGSPCQHCGAGQPGYKVETTPTLSAMPEEGPEQLGVFDRWALAHPHATLEDAFAAGYLEGVRYAKGQLLAKAPPAAAEIEPLAPEGKRARTLVAALTLFRDQVLGWHPEEVASGEWCSVEETTEMIAEIEKTYEAGAVHA